MGVNWKVFLKCKMYHLAFITIFCCFFSTYSSPQNNDDLKAGALFFVSSSSTTSTHMTVTYCYSTAGTISSECYRRRRRAIIDKLSEELIDAVSASAVEVGSDDDALELEETTLKPSPKIIGEFLLYAHTVTETSTTTYYTQTRTLVVSSCTPPSYTQGDLAMC